MSALRVIGLMSGTSLDGMDAALVEFDGDDVDSLSWRLVAFVTHAYTRERREQIHRAILEGNAETLCRLHSVLGEWFAEAALDACRTAGLEPERVDLIGSHGQTIWHEPRVGGRRASTLQLGCPATIAERTGIGVISDFRTRDTAAGGEGAPLVPWADRVLFASPDRARILQNIGGIANLSRVPPRGAAEPMLAFDTGPGNVMMDAAVELATAGRETFDRDGRWARRGEVDTALLDELLGHPFLAQDPPKSTGRETFGMPLVRDIAQRRGTDDEAGWADLVATLTAYTARTIADAIRRWVLPRGPAELVLTGGGTRNPVLREAITAALPELDVLPADALGFDPEAKEAVAFAGLAWAFRAGVAGNVPEATGAAGPRLLGSFTPGRESAAGR
ncbi:MAG: anhydro-N-acetylmuramic acid kinase, partial [Longimicrobiales bacterium]